MYYLSRAFVEFGPFAAEEMSSFQQRGLLKETDYIRAEGTEAWHHINDWQPVTSAAPSAPAPSKTKSPAVKAKATVAKKAAVKKTKKAA